MKRLLALLLTASITAPALAQHAGHTMPMPVAKPKPKAKTAAKPVPRKAPAKAATAKKAVPKPVAKAPARKEVAQPAKPAITALPASDPHAGHDIGAAPILSPGPDVGHDVTIPVAKTGAHAGHDMNAMPGGELPAPPAAPPPPGALSGPAHAADAFFGRASMAEAREDIRRTHGAIKTYKILVDQAEAKIRNGRDGYFFNAEAWYGGDIDKLWLKAEGEGDFGSKPEQAEVQALWSHAVSPWFDLQTGIRHDLRPNPRRTHIVAGIEGLAPYWIEIDVAVFLSNKGDLTARFEAEYDQRLTQKLILQPRVEFNLAAQDAPEIGIGSGLSTAEAGLRLRYQIVPEFAPYIGVEYERAFHETARLRRASGDDAGGFSFVIGLRSWF